MQVYYKKNTITLAGGEIMSGVIEILFWMLVVAGIAFAPLGFFIYQYVTKNDKPFVPKETHGDHESPVSSMVDKLISHIKTRMAKG
jgi:hypothetical protein